MNSQTFCAWASKHGVPAIRSRRAYAEVEARTLSIPRTDPKHWQAVRKVIAASIPELPDLNVEGYVQRLSSLARYLRTQPGDVYYADEGRCLVLRYTRNSSSGSGYPFTDYCEFSCSLDLVTGAWETRGIIFGAQVSSAPANEPGVFMMESLGASTSHQAIVRDFLLRALMICERYGAQNLDLFLFKLQEQIRSLGIITRLGPTHAPNYASFSAAEVPFHVWFATTAIGLGVVKFSPSPSIPGYPVSTSTFRSVITALEAHVSAHKAFVSACIAATNR